MKLTIAFSVKAFFSKKGFLVNTSELLCALYIK